MANHYIRQDIERQLILRCLTDEEIAVYINDAIAEKLENDESKGEENERLFGYRP